MSVKATLATAAIAAVAMTGASGVASAHHFHHFGPHLRIVIGDGFYSGGSGGCGYLRAKWEDTGSYYWKRRYFACKGWW